MFRKIRRVRQTMSDEKAIAILKNGSVGVLALLGDEGYPYSVPINYVYHEHKLYFHSAVAGHKIDAIRKYNKASFCVIAKDDVIPEKYTTFFKSAICFGKIRILEDLNEVRRTIELLAIKYHPTDSLEGREHEINRFWNKFVMIELDIEHLSAKQAIELVPKQHNK